MDTRTLLPVVVAVVSLVACTGSVDEPIADGSAHVRETTVTDAEEPESETVADRAAAGAAERAAQIMERGSTAHRLIYADAYGIHKLHWYVPQPE